jgi:hypothetical protein
LKAAVVGARRVTTTTALDDLLLLGDRVIIRSYTRDDADRQRLWPVFADPLLESYNLRLSPEGVDEYFNYLCTRTDYVRYTVEDDTGDFIGSVSLRDLKPGVPRARLGIVLRRDCCGRGFGPTPCAPSCRTTSATWAFTPWTWTWPPTTRGPPRVTARSASAGSAGAGRRLTCPPTRSGCFPTSAA